MPSESFILTATRYTNQKTRFSEVIKILLKILKMNNAWTVEIRSNKEKINSTKNPSPRLPEEFSRNENKNKPPIRFIPIVQLLNISLIFKCLCKKE